MRLRFLLAGLVLLMSVGAAAQTSQSQTTQKPKKAPKPPKPKKHGPMEMILPIVDHTGVSGEESVDRCLFARAGVLDFFNKKKIESISPAEIQGTADQLQIDFTKTDNWTAENLDKLAQPWDAQYVAAVELVSLTEGQPSLPDSKKPATALSASVQVNAWLYDVKNHTFILRNSPSQSEYVAKPAKDASDPKDRHMDPKSVAFEAIVVAVEKAFKDSLNKPKSKT